MSFDPKITHIGAALSDQSRVRMLCELMDGRAHTGKELASAAGIAANTASEHLKHLADAGLIIAERSGRFVYHRIASAQIAETLEQISALSPTDHLYRKSRRGIPAELVARTCYNHIAGRLGVLIASNLLASGTLKNDDHGICINPDNHAQLKRLGILAENQPPPQVKSCLDWSERRTHFSGPFGIAFLNATLRDGWVERSPNNRSLTITDKGFALFETEFGIAKSTLFSTEGL